MRSLTNIIEVARPIHWIKNLAVFSALIFSGTLTTQGYIEKSTLAFLTFCLVSSSIYIINDIFDASSDRLHPIKKERPIASGKLGVKVALLESVILFLLSIRLSLFLGEMFTITILTYFIIQLLYSIIFKKTEVIDIIIIATGFILRVYGGAFAINAHLSVWFLLCVISVSLFLASGKRRAELSIIQANKKITRISLLKYKKELLNSYVTMFGNAAWMSWSLFTFFESPKATLPVWIMLAEISKTITINKLLMTTIPFVIFAIMRYEKLIFENKTERPEKIILTDAPLVGCVLVWLILVLFILYSGIGSSF